ncbi:MAG: glutamate--tRNA ligase [Candidatus Gracilibacteria bacterium]|jgi:glutamyl-tRNA synthetase|nr:glutamate--tRNA ligase [Candidatus Gracilibacteria bacterium]
MSVITRIPPSPTGLLHVGTVRTALFNYLFSKKNNGKVLFRMEDTDKERSERQYEENILSGLKKLGISYDGEVVYQSARTEIYKKYLQQLLDNGKAYKCFCAKEKLDKIREEQIANKQAPRHECDCTDKQDQDLPYTIRFKVEQKEVIFKDLVRGEIKIHSKEISDFVIAKDMDTPLYNFCVVVDDHEMGITHVIRGEDHISNTPKQILIFEALGLISPEFAHLPLILNQDKSKLSKRKNKVSVDDFIADGILPEALINFLALLGWNTKDEKEIFTMDELIQEFSLENVNKAGAIFDEKKLLWINGVYIRSKDISELKYLLKPYLTNVNYLKNGEEFFEKALILIKDKLKKLSEIEENIAFFFKDKLEYDKDLFEHQKMKVDQEMAKKSLQESISLLESQSDWSEAALEEALITRVQELGLKNGQLLWPMRVALTGEKFSPGVFELLHVFNKEMSMDRLKKGLEKLQ